MTGVRPAWLDDAWIDPVVLHAHPDYVAVIIAASGLNPGETSQHSEAMLHEAEQYAIALLGEREPHDLPEVARWRQAYLAFGVKPREARSSVEALLRRVSAGLPRIDRLTDVYNAVSVLQLTPLGGEDVAGYVGVPRLVAARGDETFDTVADGEAVVHQAMPGEIVWRDDVGVTCRRWNWRQCVRTRLSTSTTEAIFIIDALGSDAQDRAANAADELITRLTVDSPAATFASRMLIGG